MKKLVLIGLVTLPLLGVAQEKKCNCPLSTTISGGIIAGKSNETILFQAGAGFHFQRLYVGAGAGIDPYKFHSVPLFSEIRFSLLRSKSLYLYNQFGFNFPYDNNGPENWESSFKTRDRFEGGLFLDAGMGYRLPLGKRQGFSLSAGYSYKRIHNIVGYTWPCLNPPCLEERFEYKYDLGRIVTKLNWEINLD